VVRRVISARGSRHPENVRRDRKKTKKVRISRLRFACVALLCSGCTGDAHQNVLAHLAPPSCFEIRYEYPTATPDEFLFPADPYRRSMPGPFVSLASDSASPHPRRNRVELVDPTGERIGPFSILSGWEVLSRDSIKLWWTAGSLATTWYRLRVTRRGLTGRAWYEAHKTESFRFETPGRQVQFLRRSCEALTGPAAAAEARLIHFGPHPTEAPFWPYDSADFSGGLKSSPVRVWVELLNPESIDVAMERELGPLWDSSWVATNFLVELLVDRTGRTVETRPGGPVGYHPTQWSTLEGALLRAARVARFRHLDEQARILPTWTILTIRYPRLPDSS